MEENLDSVLAILSEKAKADFALAESNRRLAEVEQAKTAEISRQIQAQKAHTAILRDLTEKAGAMIAVMPELTQAILAIREWQDEASERFERLERAAILGLSGRSDGAMLAALKETEHISSLKRQLAQQIENLNILQEENAASGFDLALENKIKKTSARIEELRTELDGTN